MVMVMETSVALPSDRITTAQPLPDAWVCPTFKVSGAFSSHMVLQREKPIRVWGFSDKPGSRVAGSFMGETVATAVGEDNRWMLTFSAHAYTREGQIMMISDDRDHTVLFEDILIGDVWLIGGQSNGELPLHACLHLTPSIEFDEADNFRLFTQTQAYCSQHPESCQYPQPDTVNPDWCWKRPGREASLASSAMGWYFAKELQKRIDIPLGLVGMAAGGAHMSELLPVELAHGEGFFHGGDVCEAGYYNALIHPFLNLAFKGMMFFQGESESGERALAERYDYLLTLLITDERARFGWDFPLYNVQLSDYCDAGAAYFAYHDILRIQQFRALSLLANSTLTVDMDLGPTEEDYADWAHSPRKMELGERLALLIGAKEYDLGRPSECGSPMPVSAAITVDRKQIVVEFTDVSAGLIVSGHTPADSYGMEVQGFSLGDYDHRTPARAVISSRHAVTVDIPEGLEDPAILAQVNYAFFLRVRPDNADLRGGNNLPAPAFSLPVRGV